MIVRIDKSVRQVETNDIRAYISDYENESNAGKVTLDNIRRIISSFFAWLELVRMRSAVRIRPTPPKKNRENVEI